jgi:NADPH-dependent glutamate synthase beta subunit-like oxidoreductase
LSRCILCGRCVRACHDLRGVDVMSFIGERGDIRVGVKGDQSLIEAGCRFCAACVEVCPTGTIRDQEKVTKISQGRRAGLVPCSFTCPAGIDVPRYIRFIREKKYPQAVAVIREKVPFPAVLGYICNHLCEGVCRHGDINEAIAIRELKRFAAERDDKSWKQNITPKEPTGKRVAVVGSGPAGLTAAYYLARQGHAVTVFEAFERAGGMLRFGIPAYRLPDNVLDGEIQEIESLGIEIKTNTRVTSLEALQQEGYNAVLVAVGAHQGQKLKIPGADLEGVLVGIPFLREARRGQPPKVGKKVVVIGGGNVAFDCARTALRLGAADVTVTCLESRENMLSTPEEIAEGCEEGIKLQNAQSFVRIVDEGGRVAGVECLDVKCFDFDDEGRLNVECVEGSSHVLPADTVIFAIGQRPEVPEEFGLPTGRGNTLQVEYDNIRTEKEGIFAAGDAVTGTSSVIKAIAAGRQAASVIDQYLDGSGLIDETLAPVEAAARWLGPGEGFACQPRSQATGRPVPPRAGSFDMVEAGLAEDTAIQESARCLQCDLRLKMARVKFWADYA